MAAQQQALQAEYELQKATTLAKAKVAEAQGDADSTLVKAKAQSEANRLLQSTLTPMLVQAKAIDRWNGELPTYTGGGALPFISLGSRRRPSTHEVSRSLSRVARRDLLTARIRPLSLGFMPACPYCKAPLPLMAPRCPTCGQAIA